MTSSLINIAKVLSERVNYNQPTQQSDLHINVNGKTVNIPSYSLKDGDVVELSQKSKEIPRTMENELIQNNIFIFKNLFWLYKNFVFF